jgi:hypothetical protein
LVSHGFILWRRYLYTSLVLDPPGRQYPLGRRAI